MGKTQKKMAFSSFYLAVGPDRAVDVVVLTIPEDLAHRADLGGAVALLAPVYTYCNNADDDDAIILCARAQLIVLSGSGGVVPADSFIGECLTDNVDILLQDWILLHKINHAFIAIRSNNLCRVEPCMKT
jgi:hypothetical protein